MWMFSIPNDFSSIGDIVLCSLELHERLTRELRPQTCISHSLMQHWVCILCWCEKMKMRETKI